MPTWALTCVIAFGTTQWLLGIVTLVREHRRRRTRQRQRDRDYVLAFGGAGLRVGMSMPRRAK